MNYAQLSEEGKAIYKKVICEELWLKYYNDTLRRNGIISEQKYLKMHEAILVRTSRLLQEVQ